MLGILKKTLTITTIIILISLTLIAQVHADTIGYLPVTHDSSTEAANIHNTHGTDNTLTVTGQPEEGVMWTYIMVNISSLTHYVKEAYLELYVIQSEGPLPTLSAWNTTADWVEADLDWNNQPVLDELQEEEKPINPMGWAGQATYINITNAVLSAQANAETNVSIALTNDDFEDYILMFSVDETDAVYDNRLYYIYDDILLPSSSPAATATPGTFAVQTTQFLSVIVPVAAVGIPALIMAAFLGKWGFITGATLGATFGFLAIPLYIPYWLPLFVGLGSVVILFMSFRSL